MSELPVDWGLTLGQVTNEVRKVLPGASDSQVKYALDRYRIEPVGRVGILRVWSKDDVSRVVSALRRIAASRGGQCL